MSNCFARGKLWRSSSLFSSSLNSMFGCLQVVEFCKGNDIGLVAVGPEAPLVDGLVDHLTSAGVTAFGPTGAAAQLEGSKAFMKVFIVWITIPILTVSCDICC